MQPKNDDLSEKPKESSNSQRRVKPQVLWCFGRLILGQTISSQRSMSLFHFLPDNFAQLDPLNAPVKFRKHRG